MTKPKYRRTAATSASSFRRPIGKATAPGSAILVVTEGKNTEPTYFNELKRKFAAPTVELVPSGEGKNDPRVLVDAALRIQKDRRGQARRKELGINQLEDFDELWIVFDTDILRDKSEKLHNGVAYAKSKHVKIAFSEPCFEYWLLLHSPAHYTTALMPKCEDVIPYLKNAYGWERYSKKAKETAKLILPLVEKERVSNGIESRGTREGVSWRRTHPVSGQPFDGCR